MHTIWDFPPPSPSTSLEAASTVEYRVFIPKLTLVATRRYFHYFKLQLHDIHRFFQDKTSWNTGYGPAQQIYSDSPTSAALRTAIYTEHTILYSGRRYRIGNAAGALDRNPNAFFQLLDRYPDRPLSSIQRTCGRMCRRTPKERVDIYTYVLMDDSLRFSRSGARTSVDMSSKHALHAGAAPSVYYAGEFWVEYVDGERTLFVDNNSGTFAPSKDDLYRMQFLMQANFPGIQMVVLDYQDPEWKRRRGKE